MKLSTKVLAGSLASAGMILGAVAPAMTAQAATTSGGFVNGVYQPKYTPNRNADPLANGDHTISNPDILAIAYDKDGVTGTATGDSNVNVKVVSGLLTLDAVPDLGFGSGASGTTVALKDNIATGEAHDGNNSGVLQVTDSRAAQEDVSGVKKGDTSGFQLTAQLKPFSTTDAPVPTDPGQVALLKQFTLTLNSKNVLDGSGANASTGTALQTSEASLVSDGQTPANILSPDPASYKVGTLKTSFTGDNAGAKLAIPAGLTKNDKKDPSIQSYKSVIVWTLDAAPKTNV